MNLDIRVSTAQRLLSRTERRLARYLKIAHLVNPDWRSNVKGAVPTTLPTDDGYFPLEHLVHHLVGQLRGNQFSLLSKEVSLILNESYE